MRTMTLIGLLCIAFQCNAQRLDFKSIDFKKADSIALVYKGEKLDNLPHLTHKLTAHLNTDVERFRAIYRWICASVANDYRLYFKNERKRQRFKNDSARLDAWNNDFKKLSFIHLRKRNRTICTGYAYLVKKMSTLANIPCEIIQGYGKTSMTDVEKLQLPNHTWNAVFLNGKWYLCDATWASGVPNPETNRFKFIYNDGFFFPNPKLFAVNHYPVDEKWLLLEKEDACSFDAFLEAPILYNEAYTNLSVHNEPEKLLNTVRKNEKVIFSYQLINPSDAKRVSILIDNGYESKKAQVKTTLENHSLIIEYQFERKGFYDVHFMIGTDLISTYTFDVKG